MTTTPAPTDLDLDALKALLDNISPAPWRVALSQPNPGIRTAAGWEVVNASYADSGPRVLEFIAAARNALPALLDELANARTLIDGYAELLEDATAKTERHFQASLQSSNERDAAREELAKTRAELARKESLLAEAYEFVARASHTVPERYESWHARTERWLERARRDANPATTAEPATQHGPSAHGRACCNQLPAHMLPTTALDCGGIKACDLCREWADEIHGAGKAEPADEPKATCGHAYIGNEGEFTCDRYAPHDGKHRNYLAEFEWTDEPNPERAS